LALIVAACVVWGIYFLRKNPFRHSGTQEITKVHIKNKIIELGDVKKNHPAKGKFELVNSGAHLLIIENVNTDCSCTVSEWDKSPIKVGSSTFIELTYDSHNLGYFQKKAYVKCNCEENTIVLVLRGNVLE
jgi:hypothetical protein